MKQEVAPWQWHQFYHMEIICTSLHASTSSLNFLQAGWRPPNQQCRSTEGKKSLPSLQFLQPLVNTKPDICTLFFPVFQFKITCTKINKCAWQIRIFYLDHNCKPSDWTQLILLAATLRSYDGSRPGVQPASLYDNFCKTGNDVIDSVIIWVQDGNCKKWSREF